VTINNAGPFTFASYFTTSIISNISLSAYAKVTDWFLVKMGICSKQYSVAWSNKLYKHRISW